QGGDVEHPVALELAHQAVAQRVFVNVLEQRETAQVAHHREDVLVDGIDVKQVVLHLPDDVAEGGQVAAENTVLVHAPQRGENATRRLQNLQELRTARRSAAEFRIDTLARTPQSAQRRCGHAAQFRMLLQ